MNGDIEFLIGLSDEELEALCAGEVPMTQTAFRFAAEVGADGKLELKVPIPSGTAVEVVVFAPQGDDFGDLLNAAQSGLDFWNNPQDDADWNDAQAR